MIFIQFLLRMMEQMTSDAVVNLYPSSGRLLVKTWSALALREIIRNGPHARSRDLGSKEAASQHSEFYY